MIDNPLNLEINNTIHDEWHERDRHSLVLYVRNDNGGFGDIIVEWRDDAYVEAVADGFIDPRRPHESAFEYALINGFLNPDNRIKSARAPTGYVVVHEDLGVLMTWKAGGHLVWSSAADAQTMERGAVSFADEPSAREFFEGDLDTEGLIDDEEFVSKLNFHELELDVIPNGHTRPRRVSVAGLAETSVLPPSFSTGV